MINSLKMVAVYPRSDSRKSSLEHSVSLTAASARCSRASLMRAYGSYELKRSKK